MANWNDTHLLVVAKMLRVPVTGSHHKQKSTIVNWCGGYDGDTIKSAIDDLIAAGIIREKGRGTITLASYHSAENFLETNDDDDDYIFHH